MRRLLKQAEAQYGVFTLGQAVAAGVSPKQIEARVRDGTFERMVWSVYRVTGTVPCWRQRLWIAVLAAGAGAAVCGRAAAALYRLPSFGEGPVEVVQTRRPSRRFKYGAEHSSRYLPEHHLRAVDGIPVVSPERMLFELCGRLSAKRAERVVKDALSRELVTIGSLAAFLAEIAKPGRKGVRALRAVLAVLDDEPVTESALEDLVIAVLLHAGLPVAERQVQVGGTTAPIGRIDFLIRAYGIVIEADSKRWHGGWVATEADHRRDALLTAAGYHVIRTNWHQLVTEPEVFIAAVRGAIRRAA